MHRTRTGILALLAALCLAPAGYAAPSAAEFVKKVSIANQFEIASSKAALDKSKRSDVRQFAQMMIDDHGKAGTELKSAVKATDVDSDLADSKLDEKHQSLLDTLNNASDKEFDALYINAQKDAHKEAIALFGSYASEGDSRPLKDFASSTLPTLKKHRQHVMKL